MSCFSIRSGSITRSGPVVAPGERTLDFPGHGSEPPTEKVSMAGLVEYVLAHVSEPVTLVGLSLGGMVAQQIAVRAPEAVASLVVAASPSATRAEVMADRIRATREGGMAGVLEA